MGESLPKTRHLLQKHVLDNTAGRLSRYELPVPGQSERERRGERKPYIRGPGISSHKVPQENHIRGKEAQWSKSIRWLLRGWEYWLRRSIRQMPRSSLLSHQPRSWRRRGVSDACWKYSPAAERRAVRHCCPYACGWWCCLGIGKRTRHKKCTIKRVTCTRPWQSRASIDVPLPLLQRINTASLTGPPPPTPNMNILDLQIPAQ